MFGTQKRSYDAEIRCQFCGLVIGNGTQGDEHERRTLHESYCNDNPEYDRDGEPALPPNRDELPTVETNEETTEQATLDAVADGGTPDPSGTGTDRSGGGA